MFSEFLDQLEVDSYFSVNAFWHREKHRHYLRRLRPDNRTGYGTFARGLL